MGRTHKQGNCAYRFLYTITICLACLITFQAKGLSQPGESFTLKANNIALSEVFKSIYKQTKLKVTYSNLMFNDKQKIDVNFSNTPIRDVMAFLLKGKDMNFEFAENLIIIGKKEKENSNASPADTLINVFPSVIGKVTDASSSPLIGATVMVKGRMNGTTTDTEGKFNLSNVKVGDILIISSVGYETREIKVKGKSILAQLNVVISNLDETVVIAYGTTTKRYNTGNIATIKARDIEKQPVNNPLLALQGRVSGVTIEQSTGLPGSGIVVRIQGENSLRKGNDPLYVVDGVPYTSRRLYTLSRIQGESGSNAPDQAGVPVGAGNPLSFINLADIESIDILKDADATSIYGSRAANGAILITTKKGRAGQTRVDINLQNGWASVARKVKLLNTQEYLALRKEAYTNDGIPIPTAGTPPDQSNLDLIFYDQNRNTDWQDVLIGNTAKYTDINASVSGGTPNTQFLIGAGYHRETTVFPGDLSNQKSSLHFNINNTSPNQRFRIALTGNYMHDNNYLIAEDLTGTAMTLAPNSPALYNADRTLNWAMLPNGDASWKNPLTYLNQKYRCKTQNLIANATLSYQILSGLDIRSSFGYTNQRSDEILIKPLSSRIPQLRPFYQDESTISSGVISTWIIEPQLSYKKAIGKSTFDVLLGGTFQQNSAYRTEIIGTGYSTELLLENVGSATNRNASNSSSVYRYNAMFGRINYNWANKYITTLSARRDGSSRFGSANLFHNFSSIAGAWLFSNEEFFKHGISFVSFGKLKASYGTTGNDGIGEYQFLNLYNTVYATLPYQGVTGLEPNGLNNPYLQWEETRKLSVGLDFGFLDDRILFGVNYYRNRSSNQLLDYPLPIATGFQSITQNLNAVVQNTGWEFNLNTNNISNKIFQWSTNFNLTIPRNKLISYPNLESSSYAYDYVVGQSTNLRKVYKFVGVNSLNGLYQIFDKEGKSIPEAEFGTLEDRTVSIDLNRKYYGGLQNTFKYKTLELDILFEFVKQMGADYHLGNQPGYFYGASNIGNQPIYILDRWQKPGDVTTIQKVSSSMPISILAAYFNTLTSNALYSDASYVRLKNISLSWTMPKIWLEKVHIKNARVFLQGQNLLTITNYKGLDPETRNSGSLPPLRVLTLGLHVSL